MNSQPLLTAAAEVNLVGRDGREQPLSRDLVREHRLTLLVDGFLFGQLVCTRALLRELVLGRLCTAGRIAKAEDVISLSFSAEADRAEVCLRPGAGSAAQPAPRGRGVWRSEDIFRLAAEVRRSMPLHDATRGTHGCLLMHRGEILCCCEDIGRHNAIDKAVGTALTEGIPLGECILYTTGRIAVDIAEKAAMAGIPVLVSRTLPTAEAAAMAESRGITLIGRAWEDQYEIFVH